MKRDIDSNPQKSESLLNTIILDADKLPKLKNSLHFFKQLSLHIKMKSQQKLISKLIKSDLIVSVFEYMNRGYVLNKEQENKLDNNLFNTNRYSYNFFEYLLKNNIPVPDRFIAKLAIENVKLFESNLNVFNKINHTKNTDSKYPYIQSWIEEKINQGNLEYILFDSWKTNLKKSLVKDTSYIDGYPYFEYYRDKVIEPFNLLKENILCRISEKDLKESIENIREIMNKNKWLDLLNSKKMVREMNAYVLKSIQNSPYSKDIDLNVNNIELMIEKNKEILPKKIFNLLNNIVVIYNNISYKEEKIRKIYQINLPQMVSEYITIKPFKNKDMKNPEELMQVILEDIKIILNKELLNQEQKKLSELSISNRYVNTIKKGI